MLTFLKAELVRFLTVRWRPQLTLIASGRGSRVRFTSLPRRRAEYILQGFELLLKHNFFAQYEMKREKSYNIIS